MKEKGKETRAGRVSPRNFKLCHKIEPQLKNALLTSWNRRKKQQTEAVAFMMGNCIELERNQSLASSP